MYQVMPVEGLRNTYKKHYVLMKVNKATHEIDQNTPASSASQYNQVWKGMLASRISCLQKLEGKKGMMILY